MSAFALPIPPEVLTDPPSPAYGTLRYRVLRRTQLRHVALAPVHLRRRNPRPVSCYAFFKGWLLLSQPPGCLWIPTSFHT
jgi:hypothetical protein